METLRQIISSFRDLLIPFMPDSLVRLLIGKVDFVFLVHPIDLIDIAKKYPFLYRLPKNYAKGIAKFLWPVLGPQMDGFITPRGPVYGRTIFCPLTTRMMLLKKETAKKRILRAAKLSEKLGIKMLGLGAFVPIVTDDGVFLADKIKVNLTTGTAYAAIIAVQNISEVVRRLEINVDASTLAIVGAGGSVGSLCAKLLLGRFDRTILVDRNKMSLQVLLNDLEKLSKTGLLNIIVSDQVRDAKEADIMLVVTNVPGALVKSYHLKAGAVVVDAGFPKNVSKKVLNERKDVLVIESGIAEIEGFNTNFDFALGILKNNEVFSCLAEELLLLWLGKEGKFVGNIDFEYVNELHREYFKANIKLPQFRNGLGYLREEEITRFWEYRKSIKDGPANANCRELFL